MSDSLLWVGPPEPPDAVVRFAERHGWTIRTVDPSEAATVTHQRPEVVIVGTTDADFDSRRAATPATLLAYCPPETTADGVTAATAAGVDAVVPQDAEAWGVETLDRRLAAASVTVPERGATSARRSSSIARPNGGTGGTEGSGRADLRREHDRLWTLFENLPDPVVDAEHVENGPVIRAANDAFAAVFDCDREAIEGERIDEVLSSPAGEQPGSMPPEAINEQVREGEVTGAKVRRETANGARTFLFRGIPYAENGGVRAFGIYTDVTEIERQERHVKVLDRLLRHNLRNDLGIVIGRAENVIDRTDNPTVREEATELVEAAEGLIALSDTAKRIRRIIEEPNAERSTIQASELFTAVAAGARERFPNAAVETAEDDDIAVLATSDLRLALQELVENAVVHGGCSPTVVLRAEPSASAPREWVDLLVVDDGPGIPEPERAAVTGDRDITQLDHGSGLGLWLVRWVVESVGGDLGFERRNGRTVVRLRLRRADVE